MIKDLTRNIKQTKNITNTSNKHLKNMINMEHEQMIQGNLILNILKEIINRTPKLDSKKLLTEISQKRDTSYNNLRTAETTTPNKENREYYQSKLNRDYSNNLMKNIPKSTKNITTYNLRSYSPLMTSVNSKKNLNESRNEEMIKQVNKSFGENVRTLESMINEIKSKGFEKIRNEIDEKERLRKQLEIRVENLQKKVNFMNSQKKHVGKKNTKIESEMNLYKNLSGRWQREMYFMNKETPTLKQEITNMNYEYGERIKETKVLAQIIVEEDRQNHMIKEEIRKMNKKTSEVEKEKDNFRTGIALLKKHVAVLKDKIKNEHSKTQEFITNVSTLLDKSQSLG